MKRTLSLIGATLLMCFFLGLSLHGKDLHGIWAALKEANYWWVLAYVVGVCVIHFLRTIRWRILLEPVAKTTFREVNMLAAVGFMLLMILPLRLGEFGRPLLVAERLKVSRSASLASVVFERIVDGLTMGALLVILVWALGPRAAPQDAALLRGGAAFVTLAFGGGLVLLVFAAKLPGPTEAMVRHTLGRIAPKIAERVVSMIQAFTAGLRVLPSVGKAIEFFALTAVYWACSAWGLMLVFYAFRFKEEIPWMAGLTIVGLQVVGAMIPGGPGSAGAFQWFTQFGLALFVGHSPTEDAKAAAAANVIWIIQFTQQVVFGLYFVVTGRIHPKTLMLGLWRGSPPPEESAEKPPKEEPPGDERVTVSPRTSP